jgi:WD40 repeat protein
MDAQQQAEARRQFLSNMLVTVANTTYNEQGKQPCDDDTRIDILADIRTWIHDKSGGSQSFLWLTGDPGSGKSAITASVARECKKAGILWAQFFINRNNADTTEPKSYFPSIARQLADHVPDSDVALAIYDALKQNPLLVDDISTDQASRLFLDALEVASTLDPGKPVVVVIDGLDETSRPRLRVTAEIFSKLFAKLRCRNAKVFISSRTEDDIQKPFSKAFDVKHVKHIHLDTAAPSSIQDVSHFLGKRIAEIVENNDLNWEEWPGQERMQALCIRASGLFIWAATVVKFFQEQIDAMGRECLNDLLDALSTEGMDDINVLYGTILQLVYAGRKNAWAFETFRRVVGCIVVLREPLCLTEIEDLLDLRQNVSRERVDIKHFVRRLRTVLVAGTGVIDGHTVPRLHKSFFEFITSERADSRFRVNTNTLHAEVATQCLRQLVNRRNVPIDNFDSLLRYALGFWTSHLPPKPAALVVANSLKLSDLRELFQLSSQDSRLRSSFHVTWSSDKKTIISSSSIDIGLWDAESGTPFAFPLQGHTGAVFCVAFSPSGNQIISGSWDRTLRLWDARTGLPVGSPFKGHTSAVFCVAFSPDGKQIISGSKDNTLRLWDVRCGHPNRSPFTGHANHVQSVVFSADGKQIVSGSKDRTIRVWDVRNGQPIGSPINCDAASIRSVAFSPDCTQIISALQDNTLRLWNARSGQAIGSPFMGHTDLVWAVAFSPDGMQIISGSKDSTGHSSYIHSVAFSPDGKLVTSGSHDDTIRVWDAKNGQPIGSPLKSHTGPVRSVAFSPDGKRIVSGSSDCTLCLWDVKSGHPIECSFKGHTDWVTSIALSPDNRIIVSASSDNTVRVWDAGTGLPIGSPLECNLKEVVSLAFSPDGSQFAGAVSDGTIRLWDTNNHSLIASYSKDCINSMSFITFSPESGHLMAFSIDGTAHVWNAVDGQPLIRTAKSSDISLFDTTDALMFNSERGWCNEEADDNFLRWFSVDDPNFGHWAYIDRTFIRRDKTGLTTIMDMDGVHLQLYDDLDKRIR